MPFTLAHPAAIVPIWYGAKKRLSVEALIIGSISPDIPYFLALRPISTYEHSLNGLFVFCLPVSLLIYYLYQRYFKTPVTVLLMLSLEPVGITYKWPHFVQLSISILIGAFTHIFLDAFTHSNGWFVIHLPLLNQVIFALPFYRWLQYLGGVLGLLVMIFWGYSALKNTKGQSRTSILSNQWRTSVIVFFPVIIALFAAIAVFINTQYGMSWHAIMVRAVIGSMSGFVVATTFYSCAFWLLKPKDVTF